MIRTVKIKNSFVDNKKQDFNHAELEHDVKDKGKQPFLTPFGFESLPNKGDNAFILDTDQNGTKVVTGHALKSKIKAGELRLVAFDQDGKEISHFYFTNNGELEIATKSLIAIKNENESLKALIDELLTILTNFETRGSPWRHFTALATRQKLNNLKSKFNNLLK